MTAQETTFGLTVGVPSITNAVPPTLPLLFQIVASLAAIAVIRIPTAPFADGVTDATDAAESEPEAVTALHAVTSAATVVALDVWMQTSTALFAGSTACATSEYLALSLY
jgi:hypothetical protein